MPEQKLMKKQQSIQSSYKLSIRNKYETKFKRSMLLHNLNNHYTKAQRKKIFPYYCEHCDYGSFIKTTYEKHLTKNKSHLRLLL